MALKPQKVYELIRSLAPESLQEEWDNSGIQLDMRPESIKKALVALEITDAVIDEAIAEGADLIVTHHPLLFRPIGCVDAGEVPGRYLIRLIENGISVYSAHTSFDRIEGGNNTYIADLLGLDNVEPFAGEGLAVRGTLRTPVAFAEAVKLVSDRLKVPYESIRAVNGAQDRAVKSIGICTGAGAEFIKDAREAGIDLFITGDVKYHDAMYAAETGMNVIDAGHYGTEKHFAENFAAALDVAANGEIEVARSGIVIDPFTSISVLC